jgi:plasmid replication initiation protein
VNHHSSRPPGALTGLRTSILLLRFPFLALGPRTDPICFNGYDAGRPFFLTVSSSDPELGLATLRDGDILIYLITLLTNQHNLGAPLSSEFVLRPSAILRGLGRARGGRQHELLAASIARLAATHITTNVRGESAIFSPLEQVERRGNSTDDAPWRLWLSSFFIEEVTAKRILQFNPAALKLRGLERRLYEWGRARAGGAMYESWQIDLERAYAQAGSEDARRKFRHAIKHIVSRNPLPGFDLALDGPAARPRLVITRATDKPSPAPADQFADDFPTGTIVFDLSSLMQAEADAAARDVDLTQTHPASSSQARPRA